MPTAEQLDSNVIPFDTAAPPLEGDLVSLDPYSDGQPWNEDRVIRHILHHTEQLIVNAGEIGRALIHTKLTLGHSRFVPWVRANLPFCQRTANNYMALAEFLTAHPRLKEPLGKARLKNVLLLTSLPPELRDQLVGDGHLAEVSAEELGQMPYVELRKLKERLEGELKEERTKNTALEQKLTERNEALANATQRYHQSNYGPVARSAVQSLQTKFERFMADAGFELDCMAQRWGELGPQDQALVDGFVNFLETFSRYEGLRHRVLRGDDVPGYAIDEALSGPRPGKDRFVIPADRELPRFGAED